MMRVLFFLVPMVALLALSNLALANSAPVVSNVTANQRTDESKLVDIYYSLADADGDTCTVWAFVSDNNGVSWRVPANTLSGHVGSGITPGSKHIIWDATVDIPGRVGPFKVRVYADDGNGTAPKVLVPGGKYAANNNPNPNDWPYVESFLIDKYEVTNQFYCQFLNAGGNDAYYDGLQEIVRTGETGNYIYSVQAGKENYPVRYVSKVDADAFCQWRSSLEGMTYQLPTKYQWQKAAAWDPVEQYFYDYGFHSDAMDSSSCNHNHNIGTTTEVGHYNGSNGTNDAKSYYGCYDMSGNVSEWTPSPRWYGGGWDSTSDGVTTTQYNDPGASGIRSGATGFRCVMIVN